MSLDADKALIEAERVRSVFLQAPVPLLVNAVNAALTAAVLAPLVDRALLFAWVGLILSVCLARWAARRLFLRRSPEAARRPGWALASVLGSLAVGALWGVGVAVLFPASEMYQLFLALVIGGMCAGTTAVNSAHLPTVLAFIVPASLPLAACFLVEGSAPRIVSAVMILVFAAALSLASSRAHRAFGEQIRFRLALDRQRRELSEANERLREEAAERQAVEATLQQAQKMEAIGHLTGGIAHDFNNLLAVLLVNLDLIREASGGDAQILDHVASAERVAERGARLTSSLLAFARHKPLRPERVSLNVLLEEFRPILRRAMGETIRLEMQLDPGLPACHADPAHFQSAVLNLAINARDAMMQPSPGGQAAGDRHRNRDARGGGPGRQPGRQARPVRERLGAGQRPRHGRGRPGKGVRPLLHHQGGRQRERARPAAGVGLRAPVRRTRAPAQRARGGHLRRALPPRRRR